jgi:hypothetical protein
MGTSWADMSSEQREAASLRQKRYEASPKGRAKYARYRETVGYRQAQERYTASGKRSESVMAYQRHLKEERPEVIKARAAVATALHADRLSRPSACRCGALRVEAHHHRGYREEHWLDIVWLCSACHKRAHGRGVI